MINQQPNRYLESSIQTANSAQLLIMSHDGAIRFLRQAIDAIRKQEKDKAHQYLMRVQDIIKEFIITLDQNSPLAPDLLRLYDYFMSKLIEANTKKETAPAEEVLSFLMELRETWVQAAKKSAIPKAGAYR